jgi:hypothetical protein
MYATVSLELALYLSISLVLTVFLLLVTGFSFTQKPGDAQWMLVLMNANSKMDASSF